MHGLKQPGMDYTGVSGVYWESIEYLDVGQCKADIHYMRSLVGYEQGKQHQ